MFLVRAQDNQIARPASTGSRLIANGASSRLFHVCAAPSLYIYQLAAIDRAGPIGASWLALILRVFRLVYFGRIRFITERVGEGIASESTGASAHDLFGSTPVEASDAAIIMK